MFKLREFRVQSENKYTHLLVFLTAFFLIFPFIRNIEHNFEWMATFFFLSITLTLRALDLKRKTFLFCVGIGVAVLLIGFLPGLQRFSCYKTTFAVVSLSIFGLFMLISIILMIEKMFSAIKVTGDVIRGGVCLYLLLGYIWTLFYYIIYHFDKGAFYGISSSNEGHLFYFSFATLTTLGYGDISPVNKISMSLATLEAICGQLYIGIFVARLIGLHIIHQSHKSD